MMLVISIWYWTMRFNPAMSQALHRENSKARRKESCVGSARVFTSKAFWVTRRKRRALNLMMTEVFSFMLAPSQTGRAMKRFMRNFYQIKQGSHLNKSLLFRVIVIVSQKVVAQVGPVR